MSEQESIGRFTAALGTSLPKRALSAILILLTAALTAYYTTVSGIELSLSEKADRSVVDDVQQRLTTIETLLRTDVAHREDFAQMREDMQRRLTRIETLLEQRESPQSTTTGK